MPKEYHIEPENMKHLLTNKSRPAKVLIIADLIHNAIEHGKAKKIDITLDQKKGRFMLHEVKGAGILKDVVGDKEYLGGLYDAYNVNQTHAQFHYGRHLTTSWAKDNCIQFHIWDKNDNKYIYINKYDTCGFNTEYQEYKDLECVRKAQGTTIIFDVLKEDRIEFSEVKLRDVIRKNFEWQYWNGKCKITLNGKSFTIHKALKGSVSKQVHFMYKGTEMIISLLLDVEGRIVGGLRVLVLGFYADTIHMYSTPIKVVGFIHTRDHFINQLDLAKSLDSPKEFVDQIQEILEKELEPYKEAVRKKMHKKISDLINEMIRSRALKSDLEENGSLGVGDTDFTKPITINPKGGTHKYPKNRKPPSKTSGSVDLEFRKVGLDMPITYADEYNNCIVLNTSYEIAQKISDGENEKTIGYTNDLEQEILRAYTNLSDFKKKMYTDDEREIITSSNKRTDWVRHLPKRKRKELQKEIIQ